MFWRNWFRKVVPTPPDFHLELVTVRGKDALRELSRLQNEGEADGFCPVMVGDDEEMQYHNELAEFAESTPEEIIRSSENVDAIEFLKARVADDKDYYTFPDGPPPTAKPVSQGLISHLNVLSRTPKKWVHIAKVPTTSNWEIPAYLFYGGWNECPSPENHVALWKRWSDQFGANIVSATHDVIEATVDSPPTTLEEAKKLAKEQYIYCPDIVDQGVETISNLTATLQDVGTWYFWWD